ncbi:hypothetical protein GQ53DRAFT_365182 [Thozetella sp. PMI_491]|nr:hypothetical protein GQ53DRAFT_365182 [Thozetella sp. PMI_491]
MIGHTVIFVEVTSFPVGLHAPFPPPSPNLRALSPSPLRVAPRQDCWDGLGIVGSLWEPGAAWASVARDHGALSEMRGPTVAALAANFGRNE